LEQAADFINLSMSLTNVLVHCMAGVSRSVSFVIAYLMKYRKMTFEDALILMRSRRSVVKIYSYVE
jgi:protein-tyrosine phosphatase